MQSFIENLSWLLPWVGMAGLVGLMFAVFQRLEGRRRPEQHPKYEK